MTDDVAQAIREDMARWAVTFRSLVESNPRSVCIQGWLSAALMMDRAAAEPVEPDRAVPVHRETVDLHTARPRRPGPYVPTGRESREQHGGQR